MAGRVRRVRDAVAAALRRGVDVGVSPRRIAFRRTGVRLAFDPRPNAVVHRTSSRIGGSSTGQRGAAVLSVPGPTVGSTTSDTSTHSAEGWPSWPRASTGTRRSTSPWRRSTSSTARVRSCAWATAWPRPIEVIPTGSIALDVALGIGGLPRGRVVEIYGPESPRARPRSRCTRWPTRRPPAASPPSSTPSTRSTPTTPAHWASTPTRCWSASPTPVSRRSRSWTC